MATPPLSKEIALEALLAWRAHGKSREKAATALGIAIPTLQSRLQKAKLYGFDAIEIPEGQKLKGTSTLFDDKGNERLQWVKTTADLDRQLQTIKDACAAMKSQIGTERRNKSKPHTLSDLLSCYILTDYHLGQLSWGEETGAEWNIQIAEDLLVGWFKAAIDAAPASEVGVLAQLGDFLHFDSLEAVTPTSRHVLDADSRYQKIVQVAIRGIRRIVQLLLDKHARVHIIMAEGNHDIMSSVWLRAMLADRYAEDPRITVDKSHSPYYAYEWGNTSLFWHHGHKKKFAEISKTFAGLYRDIFGRTKYSYAHMGHLHHVASKEDGLMIVEQHPTLAAKDAHSTRGGYISNRGASVISYHKKYGEVSRCTIRPEMVQQ